MRRTNERESREEVGVRDYASRNAQRRFRVILRNARTNVFEIRDCRIGPNYFEAHPVAQVVL